MNSSRLLLVCPRFWPSSEPRSLLANAFARAIADTGNEVTVVTRHLIGYWPHSFRLGKVNVVRLSQRSKRLMDSVRSLGGRDPWMSELGRWLLVNRSDFDLAIVIASDVEILSITPLLKRCEIRTVVRFEDLSSIKSHMNVDNHKPAIVWATPFDSPTTPKSAFVVVDGAETGGFPADNRNAVRTALKTAHPMLEIPGEGPLVLCSAPLERGHGVFELVTAWKRFLRTCPTARVWFVGSGVDGYLLFQHVRDLEIEHAVILPGSFDHASDLIMAADAIVLPGLKSHIAMDANFLVETAIRFGLPAICHTGNRAVGLRQRSMGHGTDENNSNRGSLWYFSDPDKPLANVLVHWNEWRVASSGQAESQREMPQNSMQEMALRYIELGRTMLKTNGEPGLNQGPARQEAHLRNETDSYDRR